MASKRKFKREYIILEAKDTDFRYKERILPKAFAKVEINDQKSLVSLYIENLKSIEDGYKVVAIKSDYETLDLGRAVVGEQGKGEYAFDLEEDNIEIKGIALIYEKSVPLIGFKGNKIDNYEEILFTNDDYDKYEEIEEDEDDMDQYEYIEIEEDMDEYEYIEIDEEDMDEYEYIEIEEDDMDEDKYTEIEEDDIDEYEYIEVEDDKNGYEEYDEIDFEDEEDSYKEIQEYNNYKYEEYDNVEETIKRNIKKQSHSKNKIKVNNFDEEKIQEDENKPQTAQTLLMPRQIKKGLKHFNEVKPFVRSDVKDTRWWKIEISPATLCGYTMPYLGYVNSLNYTMYSDIIMNSYKYRHYLFGVQYDEYNKRKNYIYAIPGNKQEQPDKGHTGFSAYKPCDTRNDSLGYWLCFIDSRSRRILK